jgi:hypothetical protein
MIKAKQGEMAKRKHIESEPPVDDTSGVKTSAAGRNGNVPPAEHRWKPGQSGNPKGRESLRPPLLEHLQNTVNEPIPPMLYSRAKLFLGLSPEGPASRRVKEMTNGEFLARAWLTSAQVGKDPRAAEKIFDRILGRPVQPVSAPSDGRLTPGDGNVLVIEMTETEYNELSRDDYRPSNSIK